MHRDSAQTLWVGGGLRSVGSETENWTLGSGLWTLDSGVPF